MNKKWIAATAAALIVSAPAMAQGHNYVDGFFALSEVDPGPTDDDGTGFGLKGEFQVADQLFLGGTYESIEYDDTDTDVDQIRLGGTYGPGAGSRNEGLYGRLEYVDIDIDGAPEQDGIGGHIGYAKPLSPEFRLYGEAGYLALDDLDGPELLIGGSFQVNPNIAIFSDFRGAFLDVDNASNDLDITTFRVGARFLF